MAGHRHARVLGALDNSDIIDVGAGDGLTVHVFDFHRAINVIQCFRAADSLLVALPVGIVPEAHCGAASSDVGRLIHGVVGDNWVEPTRYRYSA